MDQEDTKIYQHQLENFRSKLSLSNFKKEPQSIVQWYIDNVINLSDTSFIKGIRKISLHKEVYQFLEKNLESEKELYPLFLQQASIKVLIAKSPTMSDMAFVLKQYVKRKKMIASKDKINYPPQIKDLIRNRLKQLFNNDKKEQIDRDFYINHMLSFLDGKNVNLQASINFKKKQTTMNETDKSNIKKRLSIVIPNSTAKASFIDIFTKKELGQQIMIIYKYVLGPLMPSLPNKNMENEIHYLLLWTMVISDDTEQQQSFLINLSKDIKDYVMKTPNFSKSIELINIFFVIFDILSVKYNLEDGYTFLNLAPILNAFGKFYQKLPWIDLIQNWVAYQGGKQHLYAEKVQNIFRNLHFAGCKIFAFCVIKNFSHFLKTLGLFNLLYYLFENFIKRDYLKFSLPNQTFIAQYMQILMFYAIGFINRDRLDGQAELDLLTRNLQNLTLRLELTLNHDYKMIIMFYRIYQYRFSYLGGQSKKFLDDLKKIYKYDVTIMQITNQVTRLSFQDVGMDLPEEYLSLFLKATDRYSGIDNLGNMCYMNSFMQALFMTKKFKYGILEAKDTGKIQSSMVKSIGLFDLFNNLQNHSYDGAKSIDPLAFKQTTPQPFKSSWQQHDSGQFGRIYLQAILTELKGLQLRDKIKHMFYQKITKKIFCKVCSSVKQKQQDLLDFILPLPEGKNQLTISELLREYFAGQELDKNNMIYCGNCKKNTQIFSKPEPQQFAQCLIATISMYSKNGDKIKKPLNFEFLINFKSILPELDLPDLQYTLYAFIVHLGDRIQRGHYMCYTRNMQQNPMLWYRFDDSYVTEIQISKAQQFRFGQNETPYILFYTAATKNRVSLKTAILEKRNSISPVKRVSTLK